MKAMSHAPKTEHLNCILNIKNTYKHPTQPSLSKSHLQTFTVRLSGAISQLQYESIHTSKRVTQITYKKDRKEGKNIKVYKMKFLLQFILYMKK